MIGHHHRNLPPALPVAPQISHLLSGRQQSLRGSCTEHTNRFGLQHHELPVEKLAADFHLVILRLAVLGRTALHDIADVDVIALDRQPLLLRGCFTHAGKQLAGPPHKWESTQVLIFSGTFSNEYQLRFLIAGTKNDVGSAMA